MRFPVPMLRGRDFDPFEGFHRDFDDMLKSFGRQLPAVWKEAGDMEVAPLNVAETEDAVEISTELPGVSENEVTVSIEGQSVVIAGEKKLEREKTDKAWRVVERSYGAFRRVAPLTFTPDPSKIKATFDKGVLHVSVAKPKEMIQQNVSIPIQKSQ